MLAQLFFAFRISKFAKKWVALVIGALSVAQLGFGLATYILGRISSKPIHLPVIAWVASLILCDGLITIVMIYLLRSNRTGFSRTDRAVGILIRYTVLSGLAASATAVLVLFSYHSYDSLHVVPVCFTQMLGAVSAITVLANLHGRRRVRRCFDVGTGTDEVPSIHFSQIATRVKEEALRAIHGNGSTGVATPISVQEHEVQPA